MDSDNLVELQNSSKRIRNPFGFDFHSSWNSKPLVFKGTGKNAGQWQTLLGPIADHVAYHLWQLVKNQWHDEQTAKLKDDGKFDQARRFRDSAEVEDAIWFLITGAKTYPRKKGNKEIDVAEQRANPASLNSALAKLKADSKSSSPKNTGPVNVSALLAKATADLKNVPVGDSAHEGGTASLSGEEGKEEAVSEEVDASQVGVVPADEAGTESTDETDSEDSETKEDKPDDFAGLDTLDDDEDGDESDESTDETETTAESTDADAPAA